MPTKSIPLLRPCGSGRCPRIPTKNKNTMNKKLYNITIFSKETGKSVLVKELDASLTPREITEHYADILTYHGQGGNFLRKLTRFEIDSDSPIETSDIQDDETIILLPALLAGGGVAIRDYKDIHLLKYIIEKSRSDNPLYYETRERPPALYAVILYTDQDKSLSSYIRENARELSAMSIFSEKDELYENDLLFFVIEKPSDEWRVEIEKDLGSLAGIYFDSVWERLEGDIYKPYDKTKSYEIARHFHVSLDQFPCVVFFTSLESYQIVVVEINKFISNLHPKDEEYVKFFRMLFSKAQEAVLLGSDMALKNLSKMVNSEKQKNTSAKISPAQLLESANSIIGIIVNLLAIYKNP